MKVAVTGANGFIGKHLMELLLSKGHQIKILSRRNSPFTHPNVEVIRGDLSKENCPLDLFLKDVEVVFHCAGEIKNPKLMHDLHIDGTKRLIAALEKSSVHLVHLSSVGVYGPPTKASDERIVTEDSPYNPVGPYEITKTESDKIVLAEAKRGTFTFSILRPSNVFGANMPNNSLRAMGKMIRRKIFFYIGKPKGIATFVHVNDVAKALYLCATDERAKGKIYNLSNDCYFEEVIESMARKLNVSPPVIRMPEKLIRFIASVVNSLIKSPLTHDRINALVFRTRYPYHKIEKELGFKPSIFVPDTIGEVL